jgi:DNA-binding PadR family transcriptional regulator
MRLSHRRMPTGETAGELRRRDEESIRVGKGSVRGADNEKGNVSSSREVPPYKALSDQHYLFCRAVQALGKWAYGQRIHDWMQDEVDTMIDPSVIYTVAKRLATRKVIEGRDETSPDGSDRRVRIYSVTAHGEDLLSLTRRYHERRQQEVVEEPEPHVERADGG